MHATKYPQSCIYVYSTYHEKSRSPPISYLDRHKLKWKNTINWGGGSTFGLDTMSNWPYFWKMTKILERDSLTPNGKTKSTPVLLENRSNFCIGTPDPIQKISIFTNWMTENGIIKFYLGYQTQHQEISSIFMTSFEFHCIF